MTRDHDFGQAKRGPVAPVLKGKTRITILLDEDVVEWFKQQAHRAGGGNYQALINSVLRRYMDDSPERLQGTLRRVLREELQLAGRPQTRSLRQPLGGAGERHGRLPTVESQEAPMPAVPDKYRGSREYHLVYCRLISAARYRGTVTYQEIAKIMHLPLQGSHMGSETGHILGEISEDEHQAGRPMLSAVAVGVKGRPGPGFYVCARDLGKLDGHDGEDLAFWESEREASYATWAEDLDHYAP